MERAWEWEVLHLGKYPEINDRYCLLLLVGRDGGKKGKSIWCFFYGSIRFYNLPAVFFFRFSRRIGFFVISKEFIFRTACFMWCIFCLYDHARSSARIIWSAIFGVWKIVQKTRSIGVWFFFDHDITVPLIFYCSIFCFNLADAKNFCRCLK